MNHQRASNTPNESAKSKLQEFTGKNSTPLKSRPEKAGDRNADKKTFQGTEKNSEKSQGQEALDDLRASQEYQDEA